MEKYEKGLAFSPEMMKQIGDRFAYLDNDFDGSRRLFFENAGGSLRLKESCANYARLGAFPDCPSRRHAQAVNLKKVMNKGIEDIRIMFNAKDGEIIFNLTATMNMFRMVETVMRNVEGSNVVTTILEHPSVADSTRYFCKKLGKELRVANSNPQTGGVDADEIISLVDENTQLVAFMAAANITGAILDVEAIAAGVKKKNPNAYVLVDYVQHAPHCLIDLSMLSVDGINIAPYKFFGQRGYSLAYISERMVDLNRPRILNGTPRYWQLGSPAPALYGDITVITDYVCWIGSNYIQSQDRRELFAEGMKRIRLHEIALLHRLLEGSDGVRGLRHIQGVTLPCDSDDLSRRDLIIGMVIDGMDLTALTNAYLQKGIVVFERLVSSHYSRNIMNSFGLEGMIRVSPLHCHSFEDIDMFLDATMQIVKENNAF